MDRNYDAGAQHSAGQRKYSTNVSSQSWLVTEQSYLHWIQRFVRFHNRRHPREMGAAEVTAFLNHLASERRVAAATQNQALCALLFLYRVVLELPLPCSTASAVPNARCDALRC